MILNDIDFDEVDSYRGVTLPNGKEGTTIYFNNGEQVTLPIPFEEVFNYHEI